MPVQMPMGPRGGMRTDQRTPQRKPMQIRTPGNRYDLDMSRKPAHVTYEWKASKVMGAENTEHLINLDANGWTPVPAGRHPELAGKRLKDDAPIERGGQMLMERPIEFTEEARELDGFAAKNQVASQMQRLGLTGMRAAGKGVKRTIERPDDLVSDD